MPLYEVILMHCEEIEAKDTAEAESLFFNEEVSHYVTRRALNISEVRKPDAKV